MINLSEKAQIEVKRLLDQGKSGSFLRLAVKGGGCSGMTYDVKMDDTVREHDRSFEVHGIKIVSDPKSLLYISGMTIDFTTDLVGGGFKFINPNATGSCGCGTSFSV